MPKAPNKALRSPKKSDRSAEAASRPARIPPLIKLLLACAAAIGVFAWIRISAPMPWSFDEFYHLGLSREMRSDFFMDSFRWTPFSILYDRFVDSAPLFHLLLMPFATLPVETAGLIGVLLGQLFVVGAFAASLWLLRVPRPWWFVLALPALGTMFAFRMEMCRPQIWLVGFSLLVLALLVSRRWKALFVVSALFGLTHTGGWIAIAFAGLWLALGVFYRNGAGEEARFPWHPVAATAGGWLLGQLIHPQVPANFRLFFISNFVIPFQATGAGNEALQTQLGTELSPLDPSQLLEQWPAFIPPLIVAYGLLFQPRLRNRATLTAGIFALAFLLAGTFFARRFFELGAPLSLFALALMLRERREQGLAPMMPRWGLKLAAALIFLGALWTVASLRFYQQGGFAEPPRAMAQWLGQNGLPGERVFTAQWADSSPLFYYAPQLQSLVALDPTVFYAKDPNLFQTYVNIVQGRHADPARAIRERFGARWVTLWKLPAFQTFGTRLHRSPGVTIAYQDNDYVVLDLGTPPSTR
ncbi:MAG TPA: hypothetical protein VIW92_11610 [Thermoanaerobaculia bacterium]